MAEASNINDENQNQPPNIELNENGPNTMTDADNVDVSTAILNKPNRPAELQQPAESTSQNHKKSSQVIPKLNYHEKICKCYASGFCCIVGKRILRNEQLSDREIELRQRIATLECWIPAVTLIKVLAGEINSSNIYNLIDEQASKKSVSKSYLHSILSHHDEGGAHDIETEGKEAHRRLEEARKLLGEKQSAINERAKQIEEAERKHTSLEQKIGQLEEQLICNGIDLTKLPSTESITSFGSDDLAYITKLEELIATEKYRQCELEELEYRERIYINTLKAVEHLVPNKKTNLAVDELRNQLEVKLVVNQQLADRICLLEDQEEILKGKLAACNNQLELLTGTSRSQTMDGTSGDKTNNKKKKKDKEDTVVPAKDTTAAGSEHETVERKEQGIHATVRTDTKETHTHIELTDRSVQEADNVTEYQKQLITTSPDPPRLPTRGRVNGEKENSTGNVPLSPVTDLMPRNIRPTATHDEHSTSRTSNLNANAAFPNISQQNNQSGMSAFSDAQRLRMPAGGTQQTQKDPTFVSLLSEFPSDDESDVAGGYPMITNDRSGAPPPRPVTLANNSDEPPETSIDERFRRRPQPQFVSLLSEVGDNDDNDSWAFAQEPAPEQPQARMPLVAQPDADGFMSLASTEHGNNSGNMDDFAPAPLPGANTNVVPTTQGSPRQIAEDEIAVNRRQLELWLNLVRETRRYMSQCPRCVWKRRELVMLCKGLCNNLKRSFSVCTEDLEVAPESPDPSRRHKSENRHEISPIPNLIGLPVGMSTRENSSSRRIDNMQHSSAEQHRNTLQHDQAIPGSIDNSRSHSSKQLAQHTGNTAESRQIRPDATSPPHDRMIDTTANTPTSNQNHLMQQSHSSARSRSRHQVTDMSGSSAGWGYSNVNHMTQPPKAIVDPQLSSRSNVRNQQRNRIIDSSPRREPVPFNPSRSLPTGAYRSRQPRTNQESHQVKFARIPNEENSVSHHRAENSQHHDTNNSRQYRKVPSPNRTTESTTHHRMNDSTPSENLSPPYQSPSSYNGLESSDSSQYRELSSTYRTTGSSTLYPSTDATQHSEIQTPNRSANLSTSNELNDETPYEELSSFSRTTPSSSRHQKTDSTQHSRTQSPNRTTGSSALYPSTDATQYSEIQTFNGSVNLSTTPEFSDETIYGELPSFSRTTSSSRHHNTDSTQHSRTQSPHRSTRSTFYQTTDSSQYNEIQTPSRAVNSSTSPELSDETIYEELPSFSRTTSSPSRHHNTDSTQHSRTQSPYRNTRSTFYQTTDSNQYDEMQTPSRAVNLSTNPEFSDETIYEELPSFSRTTSSPSRHQKTDSTQHSKTQSPNRTTGSSSLYPSTDATQYSEIQSFDRSVNLSTSPEFSDETVYEELPSFSQNTTSSTRHRTMDSSQYSRIQSSNRTAGSNLYQTIDSTQYGEIQRPHRAEELHFDHDLSDITRYGELPSSHRAGSSARSSNSDQDGELSRISQNNNTLFHTSTPRQTRRSPEQQQNRSAGGSQNSETAAHSDNNETSYFSTEVGRQNYNTPEEIRPHSNAIRTHADMSLERRIWGKSAKEKVKNSTKNSVPVLNNIPNFHDDTHQQTISMQHDSPDNEFQHDSKSESDEKRVVWKREEKRNDQKSIPGQEYSSTSGQSTAPDQSTFEEACCTCYTTNELPKITRSEYERFISSEARRRPRNCLAESALTRRKKTDTKHQKMKRPHAKDVKTMTKPSIETQNNIRQRDVNSKLLPDFSCEVCDCEPCSTPSTAHSKSGKTQLNASTNVSSRSPKKNQSASAKIAKAKR